MNCTYCRKPIKLVPSASERARKFGGTVKDYEVLFTSHVSCHLENRKKEVSELIRKITGEANFHLDS